MKLSFLFFTLFFFGQVSFSHEAVHSKKEIDFSMVKKARLQRLDKLRNCISSARNFNELKACNKKRLKKK